MKRLMRVMGLESVAPKPDTSEPHPEHPVFPHLLRNLSICRPNHVWAADITYIPMAHGFAYLVAIIDWHSRRVLAWRLSNTMESSFCLEAPREALELFPKPPRSNSDDPCMTERAALSRNPPISSEAGTLGALLDVRRADVVVIHDAWVGYTPHSPIAAVYRLQRLQRATSLTSADSLCSLQNRRASFTHRGARSLAGSCSPFRETRSAGRWRRCERR